MKRLTAYCRRTVLTAAQEYAPSGKAYRGEIRQTALNGAFIDAMRGTDTGWWNDLIYTTDVIRLANYYRADIGAAVRDYLSETGESLASYPERDREFTWADVIAATGRRVTWADYHGDNGMDKQTAALALTFGLRFAVEYITGNIARDYCPDL